MFKTVCPLHLPRAIEILSFPIRSQKFILIHYPVLVNNVLAVLLYHQIYLYFWINIPEWRRRNVLCPPMAFQHCAKVASVKYFLFMLLNRSCLVETKLKLQLTRLERLLFLDPHQHLEPNRQLQSLEVRLLYCPYLLYQNYFYNVGIGLIWSLILCHKFDNVEVKVYVHCQVPLNGISGINSMFSPK